MNVEPALCVENISVVLGRTEILSDVSLTVPAASSLAIVGRSGAGKSTLLATLLGLIRPRAGEVRIGGKPVSRMRHAELSRLRRHDLGMVFQAGELMPELEPMENVAIAAMIAGVPAELAWSRSAALLDGLQVPNTGAPTAQLSGGERQRVAIARALINRPGLVIADEPTGSLDPELRDAICDLLYSIPERWGAAVLVVTHDVAVATRADRIVRMAEGRLTAEVVST